MVFVYAQTDILSQTVNALNHRSQTMALIHQFKPHQYVISVLSGTLNKKDACNVPTAALAAQTVTNVFNAKLDLSTIHKPNSVNKFVEMEKDSDYNATMEIMPMGMDVVWTA